MEKVINKLNGVALIADDEKINKIIVNGYDNFTKKIKHTEDSNFWICSISKMFNAIAINQLAEMGKLKKTDLISKYIKDYFKDEEITIYHLLTHTSGIPNLVMYKKEIPWDKNNKAEHILKTLDNKGLNFKAGTKWQYSNSGYYILALIVEKVSGMKYEDYIRKYIFDIADMKNTSFVALEELEVVSANIKNLESDKKFHHSLLFGAGDIVSNVKDLYKFAKAIIDGTLIKKDTFIEMSKPVFEDKKIKYGEGLFLNNNFGVLMIGHSGSIPIGYSTELSIYPEKSLITIVLTNNRKMIHPLVYPDANGKYIDACIGESILDKKIGLIKKAYL